ncbi:ATP-dependent DNA helicase RecG [Mycolicibacillus trivialis]|uniref:ATP-dependent DNA helicase RecG n=1 Tax=Mycolicibacillus trivialis TaxID=1798 RepID=A0A1X2EQT2_9MYCO|nr:ATP-dependent DNA helicase RecG [Mycolicibacillus trivialis]ORX08455.1 ATP-dependent DNA helicase RecG [Mycolicibacillus trivialis]
MAGLGDRLDFVIGGKAAAQLADTFGIRTVEDLLRHYPRTYTGGGPVRGPDDGRPPAGQHITIVDTITHADWRSPRNSNDPKDKYLRVALGTGRGKVSATFFHARKWLAGRLTKGTRVMLSGEVSYFRGAMQLTHPDFLVLGDPSAASRSMRRIAEASEAVSGRVVQAEFERSCYPIYPASAKMQSWDIFSCVRQVLEVLDPVPDPLPQALRAEHGLIGEDEALRAVHLAEDEATRARARDRLAFDEAVGLQWALVSRRHGELAQSGPAAHPADAGLAAALRDRLPFDLTAGQRAVLETFAAELAGPRPMNRLLQGEVGSGKTIVAVLAMLQLVDAGYQCALLAPTEVLAAQHLRSITDVLGPLAMAGQLGGAEDATRVVLLTGSMTAAQKKQVRAEIASGAAGIVVGTHALLQDAVAFHRLGMVVVDEQHRFGVEQRDQLRAKAPDGITPHLLVMTATPIPRTVALTVYGDLETSTLRELPRGRMPIATTAVFAAEKPAWLDRAWARVNEEVGAGRQAYVVAPRIDESDPAQDSEDAPRPSATAVGLYDRLRAGPLAGLRVGLMHGRLSAEEKDTVMAAFRAGDLDVLVCTTVIEVGVDVPNATMMVVMDADRFGISQLHQLRGRIGRGAHASLCLLVSWASPLSRSAARLNAVAATVDGFTLAELDLTERREGDVLGATQSGRAITLQLLSLADHRELIEEARRYCEQAHAVNPADPGLARLAARFTDTDAIDYLDKS